MTNQTQGYHIQEDQHGTRLDRFLISTVEGVSRTYLQKLIRSGEVTVNDKVAKQPSYQLQHGDRVSLTLPAPRPLDTMQPENISLDILHEDSHLIVLNKPAGMLVHPANRVNVGTLVNALLAHCRTDLSGIGGVERLGLSTGWTKTPQGFWLLRKQMLCIGSSPFNSSVIALPVSTSLWCAAHLPKLLHDRCSNCPKSARPAAQDNS